MNPPKDPTPPKLQNQESLEKLKKSKLGKSADFSEQSKTPKPLNSSMLKPSLSAIKDLEKVKQKVEIMRAEGQSRIRKKDILEQKK